ncbi:MAG: serine hydrolase [Elusimicrobia bacterium]|nr:MAG: serine hydrolase [Elusimicrobiota bacterium]
MGIFPLALITVIALLALAGLAYFWRIAPVGSGYKAKIVCSAVFACGRDPKEVISLDVAADSYSILRPFRVDIDYHSKSVTASVLGFQEKTAVYRPGIGATLSADPAGPASLPEAEIASPDLPRAKARDPKALTRALDAAFTETDPKKLRRTRAVVILKDGALIGERYAPGFSPEQRMAGWSMSKSVVNALVGILVHRGALSVDQDALFSEWTDERSAIRLDDLLRMRSGLSFEEAYEDPLKDVTQMLFNREDSSAYALAQPLKNPPGTAWSYSSGTTNLVCRLLRDTLKGSLKDSLEFPHKALFSQIGMNSALFEPDGAGTLVGSSFCFATARDWARFGELYRLDGICNGERLLPEGWVNYSTTPTPQSPDGCYGAHWWLKLPEAFGGNSPAAERIPQDAYFAMGHEGQTVTVIPSRGLVAVRHGLSIYIDAWDQAKFVSDLLEAI